MPFLSIPKKAMDEAVALAKVLANSDLAMRDWHTAQVDGFFIGLRCCLPSEVVGLIVMEHDSALDSFKRAITTPEGE